MGKTSNQNSNSNIITESRETSQYKIPDIQTPENNTCSSKKNQLRKKRIKTSPSTNYLKKRSSSYNILDFTKVLFAATRLPREMLPISSYLLALFHSFIISGVWAMPGCGLGRLFFKPPLVMITVFAMHFWGCGLTLKDYKHENAPQLGADLVDGVVYDKLWLHVLPYHVCIVPGFLVPVLCSLHGTLS